MTKARMDRETIRKRIISATLDEDVIAEMHRVKKDTGLSVSSQIQLALKGYRVIANERAPPARRRVKPNPA